MTFEPDTCPRCGGSFHCGRHDTAPCACTTVRLDAQVLAQLRERYVGCLCLNCLRALQNEKAGAGSARPARGD